MFAFNMFPYENLRLPLNIRLRTHVVLQRLRQQRGQTY
jgi:hypothetical protein